MAAATDTKLYMGTSPTGRVNHYRNPDFADEALCDPKLMMVGGPTDETAWTLCRRCVKKAASRTCASCETYVPEGDFDFFLGAGGRFVCGSCGRREMRERGIKGGPGG